MQDKRAFILQKQTACRQGSPQVQNGDPVKDNKQASKTWSIFQGVANHVCVVLLQRRVREKEESGEMSLCQSPKQLWPDLLILMGK